jgi:RND family efflux transporter MFP subunit
MTKGRIFLILAGAGLAAGGLAMTGHLPGTAGIFGRTTTKVATGEGRPLETVLPLAVSVVRAAPENFTETVLVTGSLVAREEILVGPEVEGLRVVEVLADEGDRVVKGQVLARLVTDTLDAQLAQSTAAIARSDAGIAQARSAIASAEARLEEARNSYERGKPLSQSGFLSESGMDQRESARRTAVAALASARDGLKVAEAEKAQIEAQRREIMWRRERTDIRAPGDGLVSRRNVRIGGYAAGLGEPIFRIVAKGEIELDAEVPESRLGSLREGLTALVETANAKVVTGRVRLVSPEVDPATRLGRVRILLGDQPGLHVGSFARATIEISTSRGIAVPASAVLQSRAGAFVQVVADGKIVTRRVKAGLADGNLVEVREGLAAGETVVVKSGTFLRDGDEVRPVVVESRRVSEAG